MKGERLELLRYFASLRAGMIVVVKPCGRCGRSHRGMLLEYDECNVERPGGTVEQLPNWGLVPAAVCRVDCVTPAEVAEGRVYRVVDGLESPATSEPARRPEVVR